MQTPPPKVLSVNLEPDDSVPLIDVELKNAHRMEALRPRMRAYVDATFEASPVARVMRRDWNIVSSKLYMHALDPAYRKKIEADLVEMSWQIDDTAEQVRSMPFHRLDRQWLRARRIQAQVIHPMTAAWWRSMMALDEAFALLICAEKAGMITRRKRISILLPCQLSYMAFKATAMKTEFKSADELINDSV